MRFKKVNWYVVLVILMLGKIEAIVKRQDAVSVPGYGSLNTNYDTFSIAVPDQSQTYQNYYQTPLQQQYSDSYNYNAYVAVPSTFSQGNAETASNDHWTMASNDWVPGYYQNPQINLNSNAEVAQQQRNSFLDSNIYSVNFDSPSVQPFMFGTPIMTQSIDNSVVPMSTPIQTPVADLTNDTNVMSNLGDTQSTQFGYDLATPSFSTTPMYDGPSYSTYNSESYPSNTPSEEMSTNQQFSYYDNSIQNFDNMAQTYQTPGPNYNAEAPHGQSNSLYDNNFSPAENTQYYTYDRPNDNIPPLPKPVESPLIDLTNAKGTGHSGKTHMMEQGYVLPVPSYTTPSSNDGLNYPTHKNYRSPNEPPIDITTKMPKKEQSKSAQPLSPPPKIPKNFGWPYPEDHKNYNFVPYVHKCYSYKENILFTRKRCVPIYYKRKPKPGYVPPSSLKKHSTTEKTSTKDEDKKDKQIPDSYYRKEVESSYLPPNDDEEPTSGSKKKKSSSSRNLGMLQITSEDWPEGFNENKKKKSVKIKLERTTVGRNLCKSLLPSVISMILCGS